MPLVTLGQQLRAARVLLNATQKQIAEVLKVSTDTVSRAESDRPGSRLMQKVVRDLLTRNGIHFLQDGVQRVVRPERPG